MARMEKLMMWTVLLVGACSLIMSARHASAQDKPSGSRKSERWAVLIGVDDYAYAKDLEFCGADMRALKAELTKAGFDERQVILLHDNAKDKRLQPYRANVQQQIELACGNAEKGDLILIAFSGHGIHQGKSSFLCPTDAKVSDTETMISMDWVYDRLQRSKADLRLMMVDACRNVPPELGGTRSLSSAQRKDVTRAFVEATERLPEGILLLNSCSEGEFAAEDKDLGHGVFMHFVLEGIRGKADKDSDQKVTLDELFRYASKETKLHVGTKFADFQRPKLKGNLTVEALDFEVASLSAANRPMPVKPLPSETAQQKLNETRYGPNGALPANALKTLTNSIGMELALIPADEFEMGEESAAHRVRISKPFFMGVHEVTQSQYERVIKMNPSWFSKTGGGKDDVSGLETSDCPVESVSWNDAQEFCRKLSALNGEQANRRQYRLPTEAEWEYACRAGTKTKFHFGDVLNGDKANVNGNFPEGTATKGPYLDRTTSVGRNGANAFGLYDMHGNVWEWCEDVYDGAAYSKRNSLTTNPLVTSGSESRVLRGGSWLGDSWSARSADRSWSSPADRNRLFGFRVVCAPLP